MIATRIHPGSWVSFSSPDNLLACSTLDASHVDRSTILSDTRVLEQLGTVSVFQHKGLALIGAGFDRTQAPITIGITVLALLAALLNGLAFAVLRPVKKLMSTLTDFMQGKPLPEVPHRSRDELGALASSLHDTLVNARKQRGQLASKNADLEDQLTEQADQVRRYAGELRHSRTETETSNRVRAEFLANISHEVRTPLNGIIGMTDLLIDTGLGSKQREYAESVRQAGQEVSGLMIDLLDFSVLQRRQIELDEVEFELQATINTVCKSSAESARKKGLALTYDVHPQLPHSVRGDAQRLRQILTHLIANAVKFTERGAIKVRLLPDIKCKEAVGIRFEIQDSGIGIPPEALERLFEPFTQEDGSSTRQHGDTGIGLAVCRHLAKALGGNVGVSSSVGVGSTFWFTATFRPHDEQGISETRGRTVLNGLRVLVVDDCESNRKIFSRCCTDWGMQVSEAESGMQALDLATSAFQQGQAFDLVLLDMEMPGIDGLETARRFKRDPALAELPLVMLTSVATTNDGQAERDAGIIAKLVKPIHNQELLSCLIKLVSDQGASNGPGEPTAEAAPPHSEPKTGSAARRVLIVDDNVVSQTVAVCMVEKLGFQTDVVANGLEAVDAVTTRAYEAVLMDCQMPEMDGFEATAEIRRRERPGRRIPIMAMTAHALICDRERALDAGMDDYITKPVVTEDLAAMLARWIDPVDPAAHAGAAGPAIVVSVLDDLRVFQSDEGSDILVELIGIFLEDTPPRLTTLVDAVAGGDAGAAEASAHALKSSCAQLGALGLSELCRQVELACKQGSVSETGPIIDQIQVEFRRVETALEALRSPV